MPASKFSPRFAGLHLPRFEELLSHFGGKVMMNIHIKSLGAPYPESEGMRSRGKALMEAYLENKPFAGLLPDQDPVVLPEIEHRPIKPYDRAVFADILGLIPPVRLRGERLHHRGGGCPRDGALDGAQDPPLLP